MPRARLLKPGFFKNEDLAALRPPDSVTTTPAAAFAARICFEGLWVLADRVGRLEDRPAWIRGEIFPYEEVLDVEPLLHELHKGGFIRRYAIRGKKYIEIPKFLNHQNPHVREHPSVIPEPPASTRRSIRQSTVPSTVLEHQPSTMPSPAVPVLVPIPVPIAVTVPIPETVPKDKSSVADATPPTKTGGNSPRNWTGHHPEDPEANVGVITKIAHEAIRLVGPLSPDLGETVKSLCATRRIAYSSAVVRKAIESAITQQGRTS